MRRLVALLRGLPVLALLGVALVVPVHEARAGFTWLGEWNVEGSYTSWDFARAFAHTSHLMSGLWLEDRLEGDVSGTYLDRMYGLRLAEVSYSRSFELSGPDGGWVLNWMIDEYLHQGATTGCYTLHEWSMRIDGVPLVKASREQTLGLSNGVHEYEIDMKVGIYLGMVPHAAAFVTNQVTLIGQFKEAPEPRSVVLMALGLVGAARIVVQSRRGPARACR